MWFNTYSNIELYTNFLEVKPRKLMAIVRHHPLETVRGPEPICQLDLCRSLPNVKFSRLPLKIGNFLESILDSLIFTLGYNWIVLLFQVHFTDPFLGNTVFDLDPNLWFLG